MRRGRGNLLGRDEDTRDGPKRVLFCTENRGRHKQQFGDLHHILIRPASTNDGASGAGAHTPDRVLLLKIETPKQKRTNGAEDADIASAENFADS